jgi:hypothetical protein
LINFFSDALNRGIFHDIKSSIFRPFMREFDGIVGALIFPDRVQAAVQLLNLV